MPNIPITSIPSAQLLSGTLKDIWLKNGVWLRLCP